MSAGTLIACPECDLLLREPGLPLGGKALCGRCGAMLFRRHPRHAERVLALALAAAVVFVVANAQPVLSLDLQGHRVSATLWDAVLSLWRQGMEPVAALVFLTAVALPAAELAALGYFLLPQRLARGLRRHHGALRVLRAIEPWCMVEVLVLGALVSFFKLQDVAEVEPGIGLWAFGALMVLTAAAWSAFDPRELWQRG